VQRFVRMQRAVEPNSCSLPYSALLERAVQRAVQPGVQLILSARAATRRGQLCHDAYRHDSSRTQFFTFPTNVNRRLVCQNVSRISCSTLRARPQASRAGKMSDHTALYYNRRDDSVWHVCIETDCLSRCTAEVSGCYAGCSSALLPRKAGTADARQRLKLRVPNTQGRSALVEKFLQLLLDI